MKLCFIALPFHYSVDTMADDWTTLSTSEAWFSERTGNGPSEDDHCNPYKVYFELHLLAE